MLYFSNVTPLIAFERFYIFILPDYCISKFLYFSCYQSTTFVCFYIFLRTAFVCFYTYHVTKLQNLYAIIFVISAMFCFCIQLYLAFYQSTWFVCYNTCLVIKIYHFKAITLRASPKYSICYYLTSPVTKGQL